MARLCAAHLVVLCVLIDFHLTRVSPLPEQDGGSTAGKEKSENREENVPEELPVQPDGAETAPSTTFLHVGHTEERLKAIKFKNVEVAVESIVETAMKHVASEGLVPMLKAVEQLCYDALVKVSTGACKEDETTENVTNLVSSLVRLLSALKAVRIDVENVSHAWERLRNSIHSLVATEQNRLKQSHDAGQALAGFLKAQMWMLLKIELMQYSKQVLRRVAEQEDVRGAVGLLEDGAAALEKLLGHLSRH